MSADARAALATALLGGLGEDVDERCDFGDFANLTPASDYAAAILAAMPGWRLVPAVPDALPAMRWALNRAEQRELEALAALDEAKAEIARLRAALADTSLAYDTGLQDGLLAAAELHRADAVPVDAERLARLKRDTVAIATQRNEARAEIERLRAALRQIAVWPGDRKLVASICEIALAPAPSEP